MNSAILTYILLFRPASVIAMNLFLFVPILLESRNVGFSFVQTLPFILMLSGEIALNDCCDYEKDCISKPQRPLVRGYVNVKHAVIVAVGMIVLSVLLGIAVYQDLPLRIACFLIVTVVLAAYNLKHPIIPILKTVITAAMTVLTLSFVYTFTTFGFVQFFFLGAAFFFILGREMLMDIRDLEGDRINSYKTIAVRWGSLFVARLSLAAFLISAIFTVVMVLGMSSTFKVVLMIPCLCFEFFCCDRCIRENLPDKQNKYILLLWLPILVMLIIQFL